MIDKKEIENKALEFGIHTSNVQRDYIFSWILVGIYSISQFKDHLILKGGNAFRKCYFEQTRFSPDLDFGVESDIDDKLLLSEINGICDFIQKNTGVIFEKGRNTVNEKFLVHEKLKVYHVKIYFKDFYGMSDYITIKVRLDITRFDKVYLPVQSRKLIHPYSDVEEAKVNIKCFKLEELIANKLKCLLQRVHSPDLYDYVFSIFLSKNIDINKSEIVTTFLKKTIYEPSPGALKALFLGLPWNLLKNYWQKHLICHKNSIISFNKAVENFKTGIDEMFGQFKKDYYGEIAYFPVNYRNIILRAGRERKILKLEYKNRIRDIEPYALFYKKPKNGHAKEYFYAYDRTGGATTPPGLRSYLHPRIQSLEITDKIFEPRCEIELSKAGEPAKNAYFGRPFSRRRKSTIRRRRSTNTFNAGYVYIIECPVCQKKFRRTRYGDWKLNKHKDKYNNQCFGTFGYLIDEK